MYGNQKKLIYKINNFTKLNSKKNLYIFLMIIIPLIGYLFKIYALFLIIPLGLFKLKN